MWAVMARSFAVSVRSSHGATSELVRDRARPCVDGAPVAVVALAPCAIRTGSFLARLSLLLSSFPANSLCSCAPVDATSAWARVGRCPARLCRYCELMAFDALADQAPSECQRPGRSSCQRPTTRQLLWPPKFETPIFRANKQGRSVRERSPSAATADDEIDASARSEDPAGAAAL